MAEEVAKNASSDMPQIMLDSFYAPMQSVAAELDKLEQSQLGWLLRIDVENSKFLQTDLELKDAITLLQQVPAYTAKLQAMKKDMAALTAQVKTLSVTTTKLKEKKQKEIQDRLEKDRLLLAQPAAPLEPAPSAVPVPTPSTQYPSSSKPLNSPL